MGDEFVLSGLIRKRAEITGQIIEHERQIARLRLALAHIDATLRIFDPEAEPERIRPKGVAKTSRFFTPGELSSLVLQAIRIADGPVPSATVLGHVMRAKQLDHTDQKLRLYVFKLVRSSLGTLRRAGVLATEGDGLGTRWRAA